MATSGKKRLRAEYKQQAGDKYQQLKQTRKDRRASYSFKQRLQLRKADRAEAKQWKQQIKQVENKTERKAKTKGYKQYKKLLRRKYVIAIWAVILLLIIGLISLWYYNVSRPLTDEQQAAHDHSRQVAQQVMSEGMVLMRNQNNTLPLESKQVSVFGTSSSKSVYGGGGAGGVSSKEATSLYTALDQAGVDYDKGLYNLYSNYAFNGQVSTDDFKPAGNSLVDTFIPNIAGFVASASPEMPVEQLPADVLDDAKNHSDTAIYTIARVGTETKDLSVDTLRLNDDERATLDMLNQNFEHVVLLLNTTNVFQMDFVDDYDHLDSVLWIGAPGAFGMYAVADALTGEVNPSGKLADTYPYDLQSNPAIKNTGDFEYTKNGQPTGRYFANYAENIYVGYRYYETFLNAQEYDKAVQYPFGYGLSYTEFDWQMVGHDVGGDSVTVDVQVTNSGTVPGKEVVEVYYDPPYYKGGIEKSATVLGGYAKTSLLEPGQSQTVTVTFPKRQMASYDEQDAQAWVLDKGDYTIRVARDVHNTAAQFSFQQVDKQIYKNDEVTGHEIKNRFDNARGGVTYLTQAKPEQTMPQAPQGDDFAIPEAVENSDYVHQKSDLTEPTTDADNGIKLADLKGLSYDDPKWQAFLDQFTAEELVHLAGNGGYWSIGIDRLGIPATKMYDGPASIRGFITAWASVAYPIPEVLSATWNSQLVEKAGVAMGNEAQSFNVDAAYAPSLNLHRSPLGGRNFEYYSEDPLLTGQTGAAWITGLQSTGTVAIMKHFVANDQETHRADNGLYTWMTEQSLREIYLKPFEIAAKQGQAHGAMSAFNRLGPDWAGGSKPLLTDVLRSEWGFEGFVITDAGIGPQGTYFDALQATSAGNDMMLAFIIDMPGNGKYEKQLFDYLKSDRAGTLTALRQAAHNISYYVLQTSKMD